MHRGTPLALLVLTTCAPPEEDDGLSWLEPRAPVGDRCLLSAHDSIWSVTAARRPQTLVVTLQQGIGCGSLYSLISKDDGRTFKVLSWTREVLDVTPTGDLIEHDVDLPEPDAPLVPPPRTEPTLAATSRGPWQVFVTPSTVWRTQDRQSWRSWRMLPLPGIYAYPGEPFPSGIRDVAAEVTDDGAVTVSYQRRLDGLTDSWIAVRAQGAPGAEALVELPWPEGFKPDSVHAPAQSDWYYYADARGTWAAFGPLAVPFPPELGPGTMVSRHGYTRAIVGHELYAVEGATVRRLDGNVPEGFSAWGVDGAGRVVGHDAVSVVRWSPEAGWETLIACDREKLWAEE